MHLELERLEKGSVRIIRPAGPKDKRNLAVEFNPPYRVRRVAGW